MNRIQQGWQKPKFSTRSVPWFLLILGVLAFVLLMPWFGFSWDDWAFLWISHHFKNEGLVRYFSTNRPVWGFFYQITTGILGNAPWQWQLFSLLFRWGSAALFWILLRAIWPQKQRLALWAALIFLLYPGFRQQAIAITYGHFYLIYSAFIGSLLCTVLAQRQPQRFALFTGLGMVLSTVNLFSMEYFFTLEILRPLILYILLDQQKENKPLTQTLRLWLPYAIVLVGSVVWRLFLFPYQTENYQPLFLTTLKSNPLLAIGQLVQQILHDVVVTGAQGMSRAFVLPDVQTFGKLSTLLYAGLVGGIILMGSVYLIGNASPKEFAGKYGIPFWPILLGLLAILAAGWPFWLTSLPIGLEYPNSRFTIPFILGIALFWAGLLEAVPLPIWLRHVFLSCWMAFAVGQQFISANDFRRDWDIQQQFFWQLSWRAPDLKPGTTILLNDLPIQYASDNSLTAPLNWLYAREVRQGEMDYLLAYPSIRLGRSVSSLQPGSMIHEDYLAAEFYSTADAMLAVYYQPPGCVRVLDTQVDELNSLLPPSIRQVVPFSRVDQIIPQADAPAEPPRNIFRQEPDHRWCYYFEKAELARQQADWQAVVDFGEVAFTLGDYPNDPAERLVFVEGYAHTGDWQRALALTMESAQISDLTHPMICRLWDRIDQQTQDSIQKTDTILSVHTQLNCKVNP
jgi:uncharacterized membrane protein